MKPVWLKKILKHDNSYGNMLLVGVMVVTLLSMFGITLVSRMVTDAHAAGRKVTISRAFYLADAGIQYGRKYLAVTPSATVPVITTLGPVNLAGGSVTVVIRKTREYINSYWIKKNVYKITSTATVGPSTQEIVELRHRGGGGVDKEFRVWWQSVGDEF